MEAVFLLKQRRVIKFANAFSFGRNRKVGRNVCEGGKDQVFIT